MPIDGLIVFTPKQCEFISKPNDKHICKTYQMVEYLHTILHNYPQKTASHRLMDIKSAIANNQVPYQRIPLCEQYRLDPKELRQGILCKECMTYSISRKSKSGWVCSCCKKVNYTAAQDALREYFSLVSSKVNNQQYRDFLKIDSPYTASRELAQYDLDIQGTYRNRLYQIKKDSL